MKGLTKENAEQAYQVLKEIERKDIEQKAMVLRVYYASVIVFLIVLCIVILIKG